MTAGADCTRLNAYTSAAGVLCEELVGYRINTDTHGDIKCLQNVDKNAFYILLI